MSMHVCMYICVYIYIYITLVYSWAAPRTTLRPHV